MCLKRLFTRKMEKEPLESKFPDAITPSEPVSETPEEQDSTGTLPVSINCPPASSDPDETESNTETESSNEEGVSPDNTDEAPPVTLPSKSKEQKTAVTVSVKNPMCGIGYTFPVGEHLGDEEPLTTLYSDEVGDLTLQNGEEGWHISGTPAQSRDWWMEAELSDKVVRFQCYINGNPRLMWKDIPSDQAVKPDKDYQALLTPTVDIIGVSHRGQSHAHKGAYRDDDFYINLEEGITISVVADGAGSAELSSTGSKVFSQSAGKMMSKLLVERKGKLTELLQELKGCPQNQLFRPDFATCLYEILPAAALHGLKQLLALAEQNQVPVKKYHTTALLSFTIPVADDCYFCASFQVGDGVTVALADGQVNLLGDADTGSAPGETVFVTSKGVFDNANDLMRRIRICFTTSKPTVISMTDGITDSRFKEGLKVDDPELWKKFVAEIQTPEGAFLPAADLCDWLNYYVPQEHDDRTMTIVHYK